MHGPENENLMKNIKACILKSIKHYMKIKSCYFMFVLVFERPV